MKVKITSILNIKARSAEGHALRKYVPRTVCLFLVFCLFSGCASVRVEKRAVKTSANTVTTDEILPDNEGEDVWANSHFTYEMEYTDLDKENLLLQKSDDGVVTAKVRFGKLALLSSGGEYVEILAVKEKYDYYSDNRSSFYQTGDYILCSRYVNHRERGVYCHKVGTGRMDLVTECGLEDMIVTKGKGCFYYTGLSQQSEGGRYDVWLYDCEKKENRKLLKGEQIENLLPELPTAGCDLIRELKAAGDRLYIEVRYAGNSHVLSYTEGSGKLQVENHIKELLRHKTYKMDKEITDANRKYSCCNDRNMYLSKGAGLIEERGLDGTYVRTIYTKGATLLFASNEELILQYQRDNETSEIYSVPIVPLDGNDYPDVNQKRKLTKLPNFFIGFNCYENNCTNSDFFVFVSDCHIFYVFDRKKGDYIELQNDPPANHYFENSAMSDNYMGNCFVFNTKPFGKKDDKYGFSCYKLGGNKVIRIEENFYTYGYICDDKRKQIIYEREDITKENSEAEFCSYSSEGKKKRLFTEGDLNKVLKENGVQKADFSWSDWAISGSRLYLVSNVVVSYDLEDKKIRFEKELTEQMKEEKTELVSFCGIIEGKFFIRRVKLDEDEEEIDETERIHCYDLAAKSGKMLSENDPEYLYYLLV